MCDKQIYDLQVKRIKNEVIEVFLASLILSAILIVFNEYKVIDTILTVLFVNFTLFAAYWYTRFTNRPVLFVMLLIFYVGLGLYIRRYIGNIPPIKAPIGVILQMQTSTILMTGCLCVIGLKIKELSGILKKRVDLWIPPLWSLFLVIFMILEFDSGSNPGLKRISILVLIVSLVLASFYKNDKPISNEVYYDVTLKGYLSYMSFIILVIVLGLITIPKMDYLPGARYLQQRSRVLIGDLPSKVALNRNPPMSNEILFEVTSEEPLYLREMAYSYYDRGSWQIDTKNQDFHEMNQETFRQQIELPKSQMEGENHTYLEDKQAYIYELKDYGHFLTVNGVSHIQTNDDHNIIYYGNLNNICFSEKVSTGQVGYTLYYKKTNGTFMERFAINEARYPELEVTYTQVPANLYQKLHGLASKLSYQASTPLLKANAIEAYLRDSGKFSYKIGASQKMATADPIDDFLFGNREGICQDFASSMVLLCRSIGLPSRYVVGYYSEEEEMPGKYIVRAKHAHAFVEIYISGCGWMQFDPTPQSVASDIAYQDEDTVITFNGMGFETTQFITLCKEILGAILLLFIIILGVRGMSYLYWRKRLFSMPNSKAIDELVEKTLSLLEAKEHPILEGETLLQFSIRLEKLGIDISPITRSFDNYWYGNKKIERSQVEIAFQCYKKLKKAKTWINESKNN